MYAKLGDEGGGYDITLPDLGRRPGLVADQGKILPLDKALLPNIVNLGDGMGRTRATTRATLTRCRTCGGRPASATTRRKIKETPTSSKALWDPRWSGPHLDARRLAGGLRGSRSSSSASAPTPSTTAELDAGARAARGAEAARPDVQRRGPSVRWPRGDIWIGHIWGADIYTIQEKKPERRSTTSPRRAGVKGSDTAVILGRQAPDRRAPVHQPPARRPGQRREHELHRLHGPERGGQGVHRARTPRTTRRSTPTRRSSTSSRSCSTSAGGPRQVPEALAAARADASMTPRAESRGASAARRAAAHRAARLCCPALVWLALFFVVPLAFIFVVSLGHARPARPGRCSTRSSLDNYAQGVRPDVPADVPQLAATTPRSRRSCRSRSATRSPTGSAATAGATRRCC